MIIIERSIHSQSKHTVVNENMSTFAQVVFNKQYKQWYRHDYWISEWRSGCFVECTSATDTADTATATINTHFILYLFIHAIYVVG